jgi:hypothetical protein
MGGGMPVIEHIGYVVEDLRAGVERFAADTGAGPFFAMEHMVFDEVTYNGGPAAYDHSSAFAAWGPILVELSKVHDAQPPAFAAALATPGAGVGHVGWLADDLRAETERLIAAGLRPFHTGRTGPVSAVWFDGGPLLGHPVEVLQRVPEIEGFYAMVRGAAAEWDGASELFRVMTGPPE